MKKDWLFLGFAVMLSFIALYHDGIYLALLPVLLFSTIKIFQTERLSMKLNANKPDPLSMVEGQLYQALELLNTIIQECEAATADVRSAQEEVMPILHKFFSDMQDFESRADRQDETSAEFNQGYVQIIQALQFEDVNEQNLSFIYQRLKFVKGEIQAIIDNSDGSLTERLEICISNIKSENRKVSNPVSSFDMQSNDIEIFDSK